jgi:Protein of unknown function (DUF3175)
LQQIKKPIIVGIIVDEFFKKIMSTKNSTSKKSAKKATSKKWSQEVTEHSDAMDLEKDVFKQRDPKKIAESVKRSAEKSKRRKAGPFQSAMSMINFYENRAGKNLSASQKKVLDKSKDELRKLFGREEEK